MYSQFSAKLLIEKSQRSSLIVERYRYRKFQEDNSSGCYDEDVH